MSQFPSRTGTLSVIRRWMLPVFALGLLVQAAPAGGPANIILFIGDGMGPQQVRAASLYAAGREDALVFHTFPHSGLVMTSSANSHVTDSAAAATALAAGYKVDNGVLSVAIPGDGQPLATVLELAARTGRRTGLVSTKVVTDATPAAFAAHQSSRGSAAQILDDYLARSRPDVILGGGPKDAHEAAVRAGYAVVASAGQLRQAVDARRPRVFGMFGTGNMPYRGKRKSQPASQPTSAVSAMGGQPGPDAEARAMSPDAAVVAVAAPEAPPKPELPTLAEMTSSALALLEGPNGFFVMIEAGQIDSAGHANDLQRCVHETLELDRAVRVAMAWAAGRQDTLIVVTADHETGGLTVVASNGPGELPTVTWASGGHSDADVPLWAWGACAERLCGPKGKGKGTDKVALLDNTVVGRWLMTLTAEPIDAAVQADPAVAP